MLRAFMLFTLIGFMCWLFSYVYRHHLVKWRRMSDSSVHVTYFNLFDGDERIYVYSQNKGKSLYLRVNSGTVNVTSDIIRIPDEYKTPYDFIQSGDLNQIIMEYLRMIEVHSDTESDLRRYQVEIGYSPNFDFNSDAFYTLNLY